MAAQLRHDAADLAAHKARRQAFVLLPVVVERFAMLVRLAADVADVSALIWKDKKWCETAKMTKRGQYLTTSTYKLAPQRGMWCRICLQ